MHSKAYQLGQQHHSSDDPEPKCPYYPWSNDYKEYVRGFCVNIKSLKRNDHEQQSQSNT